MISNNFKKRTIHRWSAWAVCVAMLGQNVAFAVDPVTFSGLTPEGRSLLDRIHDRAAIRYQNMSLNKKIKFVQRTEKRLLNARKRLLRMTERRFEQMQLRAMRFVKNHQDAARNGSVPLVNQEVNEAQIDESLLLSSDEQEFMAELNQVQQQGFTGSSTQMKPITRTEALANNLVALSDIRTEKKSLVEQGVSVLPPAKIAGIFFIAIAVAVIIAASILIATVPAAVIFGSIMLAFGVGVVIAAIIEIYVKPKVTIL